MIEFDHEKLDVYKAAIEFIALADMVLNLAQEPESGSRSGSDD